MANIKSSEELQEALTDIQPYGMQHRSWGPSPQTEEPRSPAHHSPHWSHLEGSQHYGPEHGVRMRNITNQPTPSASPSPGIQEHTECTARERATLVLRTTSCGRVYEWVVSVASLLSVVLYVVTTYSSDEREDDFESEADRAAIWTNFGFDIFFLFDFSLHLYVANDRVEYLGKPTTLADLLSILPLFSVLPSSKSLKIFRFFRCVRILRLYRLQSTLVGNPKNAAEINKQVRNQLFALGFASLAFLFVSAGLVHSIDLIFQDQYAGVYHMKFHEALYFIVVTITTVGYGDIYPCTDLSRIFMVFIIFVGFLVIPRQVSQLNETLKEQSTYHAPFRPRRHWQHVVLLGASGPPDPSTLRSVMTSFVNQKHNRQLKMHVVVLDASEPSFELLRILKNQEFEAHLTYVKGSPFDANAMELVMAHQAVAFFVCASAHSAHHLDDDTRTLTTVLAIKRACPDTRIIAQLHSEQGKSWLQMYNLSQVQIICLAELRNGMLAHSCLCPGLSTLLTNLVQTYDTSEMDLHPVWLQQYLWGASQQLYEVDISFCSGLPFCAAAELLLNQFEFLMIAVQDGSTTKVWRNPGNLYTVQPGDVGFVFSHARLGRMALASSMVLRTDKFIDERTRLNHAAAGLRHKSVQRVDRLSNPETPASRRMVSVPDAVQGMTPTSFAEMMAGHQQRKVSLSDHIVVLGSIEGSNSFIKPLREKQSRSKQIEKLSPIVVLSLENDLDRIETVLSPYEYVFHITGSPLDRWALEATAMESAKRVVILKDANQNNQTQQGTTELVDAQSIVVYRLVLELCGSRQEIPIVELLNLSSMKFMSLNPKKSPNNHHYLQWPLYTAGQVVSPCTLDSLFFHTLFNPGTLILFSALSHKQRDDHAQRYEAQDSGFLCLPPPEYAIGMEYGTLVLQCLRQYDVVCLGLYRWVPCLHPFVYANPDFTEPINPTDQVFLMAPPEFCWPSDHDPPPLDLLDPSLVDPNPLIDLATVRQQPNPIGPNPHPHPNATGRSANSTKFGQESHTMSHGGTSDDTSAERAQRAAAILHEQLKQDDDHEPLENPLGNPSQTMDPAAVTGRAMHEQPVVQETILPPNPLARLHPREIDSCPDLRPDSDTL